MRGSRTAISPIDGVSYAHTKKMARTGVRSPICVIMHSFYHTKPDECVRYAPRSIYRDYGITVNEVRYGNSTVITYTDVATYCL